LPFFISKTGGKRMSTENRRYYWLKLKENFFTDKRIKRLRKIYYDGVETDFIRRSRKSR
jgi:hypothetical protein